MQTTPNGSNRLIWWIMTGAVTLVVLLVGAIAQDMRNTVTHNSSDIETLQQNQAAERQALEDIRRDVHELVQMGRKQQ